MVSQAVNMSRSGVSDWIIQRVSALVLALYTLCVLGFILLHPGLDHAAWAMFMESRGMRIFTMLALVSICAHAWTGMWTIGSDYLREHTMGAAAPVIRFIFQIGCILIIAAYLLWGVNILWGGRG